MKQLLTLAVLVGVVSTGSAQQGRMVRPNALIHVVGDLNKSVAFYRDAVGFEFAAPKARRTNALVALASASAPPGTFATARTASFAIPGSEMQLVLIEFPNVHGTATTQRLYDPGVTRFSIQVRDIDAAFNRVKGKVMAVDTTGGAPVFTQRPRNETRAVMMRDPDGFVFEFVQADPPPHTAVAAHSNIINARSSLAVEDTAKALAFYRDLLGFEARPTNTVNDAVLALEGTPGAVARTTSTSPPGSTNVWFLWEFANIARTTREPRVQDPGASALSLIVADLEPLVERMKAAGVKIEKDVIDFGQGLRGAVVRSPDGLLIELMEERP
jgi:catechol 2,3-dioxygenase-like lactoylglutathione lyase family enzyme